MESKSAGGSEAWLQKIIAAAQSIGIGKRALMEDYYLDEFMVILQEHNKMQMPSEKPQDEEVFADELF